MSPGSSGLISRRGFLGLLGATAAALGIGGAALWLAGRPRTAALPPAEAVAADVKAEFLRTWRAYVRLAWGHDELKPISGGYQEFFARGHPVGLTIVESLDTLYLMGLDKELASAVRWVETNLDLDIDARFQVFETVIRLVGGLLAGHLATGHAGLLDKARELTDRLLPAFTRSPTGMPYRFVNLHSGAVSAPANFVAEIGTNLVEFATLSRLVRDDRYYRAAKQAAKAIFDRRSSLDLLGTTVNVETGGWLDAVSVGPQPPVDSYYEYLLDGYRLLGDEELHGWFKTLTAGLQSRQWDVSAGRGWYRRVQFQTGREIDSQE